MNEILVYHWFIDDLNRKITFILEKLWYQDMLSIWDIPLSLQVFLISRLAPVPHEGIGFIWTVEFKNEIIWLLNICVLLKESFSKIENVLESPN
jgi:hypothetical protein